MICPQCSAVHGTAETLESYEEELCCVCEGPPKQSLASELIQGLARKTHEKICEHAEMNRISGYGKGIDTLEIARPLFRYQIFLDADGNFASNLGAEG